MRRSLKSLMFLLVAVFMISGTTVAEASSVTYVNQAERFVFVPEDTDLFENFKGVMPGDVRIQIIDVGNDSEVPVKIYLKMNPIDEESEAFLKQLKLTIEGDGIIFYEETMDQQGELSDFIELVPLEPEEKMPMNLTLEVPLSLSNEFMNQNVEVEWIFKVEEAERLPGTDGPPKLPDTGSASEGAWFIPGLMFIAAGSMILRKKQIT